jgi:glycerophosphoryl diester phosphodiesterase
MKVTAHRGVSSLAPENTLIAFKKAAEMGCEWIEIDVQLSLDQVPVVIHDQSVDRCSDGNGVVAKMDLKSLQALDAGLWFSPQFKNERIPTLEQTLILARDNKLKVNIEIKLYPEDNIEQLCEKIKEVIVRLNIDKTQLLFSSFELAALKKMHRLLPQIRRGLLCSVIPNNGLDLLAEIDAFSVHCHYRFLTAEQALIIKQAGYEIYCYTPNTPEEVNEYWDWGVDMMITDYPQAYAII